MLRIFIRGHPAVSQDGLLFISADPSPCYCPAAVLLAFTLPKAYEAKQQDVDRLLGAASTKVKELYAKVDEVVFKKVAAKTTQ